MNIATRSWKNAGSFRSQDLEIAGEQPARRCGPPYAAGKTDWGEFSLCVRPRCRMYLGLWFRIVTRTNGPNLMACILTL